MIKRVISIALALMLVVACCAGIVSADTTVPEEFGLFIAYGGDKAAENDWLNSYWGGDAVPEGMHVTNGTIKVGETTTVSITFDEPTDKTWIVAPCLTADDLSGVTALDYDVVCKIDGQEVAIDMAADSEGRLWWNEGTGDYDGTQCIRLAGTYNEWGQHFITVPNGITSIEYTITLNSVNEPAETEGKYELFIAYGGDRTAENDWAYEYYGDATTEHAQGITATHAKIDVGQTATISLSFAEPNFNSWFFAPCLVGTGIVDEIGDIDFTITCKIDGVEVPVDMAADAEGKTWWSEGTGNYAASDCIRLAGGYNEWATKYIAEPAGFSTIEYTITINSISEPMEPGAEVETDDTYELFIAYGGDKAAENDWGWSYEGVDKEGITAVKAAIKAGETATVSLTFAEPVFNSWYFAPCLVGEDVSLVSTVDFTVVCKIDGVEVPVNMGADPDGKTWWTEGTGSYTAAQCIRLAGGYNEWATQYIAKPGQFTTIEYTITLNSVKETTPTEPEGPTTVEIDKNGTYNAYLMIQTPGWTFRNAWDDAFYGINGSGWADINNQWGNYMVHTDAEKHGQTWGKITDTVIAGNGTYSVSITDFGTIFADDFANNNQEYFNILAISTDLPAGADVTVTNVQLYVDGQLRHEYPEAYINTEATSFQILVQNIWNADVKELNYYPAPTESLEIRFTISGFAYDKADGPSSTPGDPTEPSTPADPSAPGEPAPSNPITGIVIAAIVVVAVVVVVVVVLKKKKQ